MDRLETFAPHTLRVAVRPVVWPEDIEAVFQALAAPPRLFLARQRRRPGPAGPLERPLGRTVIRHFF